MSVSTEEESELTDLVAQSQLSKRLAENSPAASSEVAPQSVAGVQQPAWHEHEGHLRETHSSLAGLMNHPLEQEAHEPIVFDQPMDTTPILLRSFDELLISATAAKAQGRINKHQCALAVRRLRLISFTLHQMPQPAPSQQLLTAMKSLCLLLRQCAHDGGAGTNTAEPITALQMLYGPDGDPLGPAQCWPALLFQHFTSRLLFQSAYRRLWAAWSMYSHVGLEKEDTVAESLDSAEDAKVMMERLFPMGVPGGQADHSTSEEADSVSQHKRDLLAYYQRRNMSPWRILYQDLEPTDQHVPEASRPQGVSPLAATGHGAGEEEEEKEDVCFRVVPHVYRYNGVPVVVKALCGAAGTGEAEVQKAAMQHAGEFVLDVGCRATWCHPHIVTCLGGYTEKFVDNMERPEVSAGRGGTMVAAENHGDATVEGVEVSKKATEERSASAAAVTLPWQRAVSTATGRPIMALGYVLELQSASLASTAATAAQTSYVTLRDLLFASPFSATSSSAPLSMVRRRNFTLYEALDICAQIADALQYIMDDSHEVSEAVRTAWLTIDPANIFVVRVVEPKGGEEPRPQQPKKPYGGGSGDQHGRKSSPLSINAESAVWAARVTSLAEGNSREGAADVMGQSDPQRRFLKAWEDGGGRVDASFGDVVDAAQTPKGWVTEVYVSQGRKNDCDNTEDVLHCQSKHFVVRYSPPCSWTPHEVAGSRWRPHARATAPASYAVVQLFLALLTGQVPYAHMKTDREVEERVFAGTTQHPGNMWDTASHRSGAASEAQVKPSNSGQGYRIPPSLPPMVANWCRCALSLDHSQPPMVLEALRDTLTTIQASLPDRILHSHVTTGEGAAARERGADDGDGSTYQEMQSHICGEMFDVLC
ncbi:hypothetical protein NXY56_003570 [Leishmania guyanensis]|uniref:Protein kinase domain-containing protein n=1 Tax=Leishmania guyanensis TaxID=5670 RepID=A0A1E1IXW6_LEIGU|nr:hypothetical protein, conserved [Leishmania guyanensis]